MRTRFPSSPNYRESCITVKHHRTQIGNSCEHSASRAAANKPAGFYRCAPIYIAANRSEMGVDSEWTAQIDEWKKAIGGAFGYRARMRTIERFFFLQVFQMFIFSCFIVFVFFSPPRHCFFILLLRLGLNCAIFCATSWVVVECSLFYFFFVVAAYVQRIL